MAGVVIGGSGQMEVTSLDDLMRQVEEGEIGVPAGVHSDGQSPRNKLAELKTDIQKARPVEVGDEDLSFQLEEEANIDKGGDCFFRFISFFKKNKPFAGFVLI